MYDAIIVGGGPAGMSAALTLGRSRRTALLCDTDEGRNRPTPHSHGFFSRDGASPRELRRAGQEQLGAYPDVHTTGRRVTSVDGAADDFTVHFDDGHSARGRRLVLATGMLDLPPDLPGLRDAWGVSAFNCPYCDGYETGGERVAVLGADSGALRLAQQVQRLCGELVLCTDGQTVEDEQLLSALLRWGVTVRTERVAALETREGQLDRVVFDSGEPLECSAAFLRPPTRQGSDLPEKLGCSFFEDGCVEVNDFQQTSVRGVFAAGDLARRAGLPFAASQIVHAASAGSLSAVVIDQELLGEELQQTLRA
ncbi:NAD(P)/FAD-dependent oxidoreductase [Streptomyces sp. NPDC057889]|uniref:NAD(P)/FAD-dependent oxidoreductase n=1 Tax=unclassified Streptomyces TaxID=2593676 RepID=UPI0036C8EEE5